MINKKTTTRNIICLDKSGFMEVFLSSSNPRTNSAPE